MKTHRATRRKTVFADAAALIREMEHDLLRRIANDPTIMPTIAAACGDHALAAADAMRLRYGVAEGEVPGT